MLIPVQEMSLLKVDLTRGGAEVAWGFRLQGGLEHGCALSIQRVGGSFVGGWWCRWVVVLWVDGGVGGWVVLWVGGGVGGWWCYGWWCRWVVVLWVDGGVGGW